MENLEKLNPRQVMSIYVANLRALASVHQYNHWSVNNKNFYGNHLLLERLYDKVNKLVDEAAEKCIGLFGGLDNINYCLIAKKYDVKPGESSEKYIKSSLMAEEDFQKLAKEIYEHLRDHTDALTLGLDDMIMSHASDLEVHVYLLKQTLSSEKE